MDMNNENLIWIVTTPSAYRDGHQCLLGEGATKAEAMADAYGPKPWPKSAKHADCSQVTAAALQEMKDSANS